MTTPHAPEGGPEPTRDEVWESLSPEDRAAIERGTKAYYERWAAGRFPSYEEAAADDEGQEILIDFYRDLIGRPIAMRCEEKLRADVATAERARLAGMASEEDRGMVRALRDGAERLGSLVVSDPGNDVDDPAQARWIEQLHRAAVALRDSSDTILATLTARRAAARGEAVEEAARVCDDAVVECRRAAQRAQEQGNSELMCSREDKADCAEALARRIRALFPPPGAEVGRG